MNYFDILQESSFMFFNAFEDKSHALKLACMLKMQPYTKNIIICYHHFWEHEQQAEVTIHAINADDQLAGILIKSFPQNLSVKNQKQLLGIQALS